MPPPDTVSNERRIDGPTVGVIPSGHKAVTKGLTGNAARLYDRTPYGAFVTITRDAIARFEGTAGSLNVDLIPPSSSWSAT